MSASGTNVPQGTIIAGFSANAGSALNLSGTWTGVGGGMDTTITLCTGASCTSGVQLGMAILSNAGNGCIPSTAYVDGITSTTITVHGIPSGCNSAGGGTSASPISLSGARQLVLSANAGSTQAAENLNISIGYYRLIGAVVTDALSNIVPFVQDNDTFYLKTPSNDINTLALSTTATAFPLSLPSGIPVEAFGRCVSNQKVRLYTPPLATLMGPNVYPTVPGYDTTMTMLNSFPSFPFRLYTDAAQHIFAQSNATGTTLYCMTDGWKFPRAP